MIRTLFLGTGEFAIPILESLLEADFLEVVGVVSQPDKPVGRKQELTAGPLLKNLGSRIQDLGIPTFQPEKLSVVSSQLLEETRPDLVIVAAYGQMVPDNMLEQPKFKALNVHGSLLPELRGAVPVQMAILQGLDKTGVTIQQMVKELDAGPILRTWEEEIRLDDTTETLMQRLAVKGAELLMHVIPLWTQGEIMPITQNSDLATFCSQKDIAKDKAEITYETPILVAERMVRAFYPWPIAYANVKVKSQNAKVGEVKIMKIFRVRITTDRNLQPNTYDLQLTREGKQLFLHLQDGVLELLELQLEGKQRRAASDYLFLAN